MGEVYADITLKNNSDMVRFKDGNIVEQNIRSIDVTAVVDTGATTLVISENLRKKLGLAVIGARTVTLAGGSKASCDVAEPVQISWKNRTALVRPWVMPYEDEILLGVLPLEEMDLIVDPVNRTLAGAHGDEMTGRIKQAGLRLI